MKRRIQNDLVEAAAQAKAAGMTYGEYQKQRYIQENKTNKTKMQDLQPVIDKLTGKYLCRACGAELEKHKNCKTCGKPVIWKAGD